MTTLHWPSDRAPDERCLQATHSFDIHSETIQRTLNEVTSPEQSDKEKAIALFNHVRDAIRYDPYRVGLEPALFVGSEPLTAERAYCVPKAITYTTLLRAAGIPALIGFADVTNHLSSPKLLQNLRSSIFAYHGYSVVWLDGRWLKATPTFNRTLCEKANVRVLDFNGEEDAIFHPFDHEGQQHMEYLRDHGWRLDFSLTELDDAYRANYPHWYTDTDEQLHHSDDFEGEVAEANKG